MSIESRRLKKALKWYAERPTPCISKKALNKALNTIQKKYGVQKVAVLNDGDVSLNCNHGDTYVVVACFTAPLIEKWCYQFREKVLSSLNEY